jgi:RNase P subunit RPR2
MFSLIKKIFSKKCNHEFKIINEDSYRDKQGGKRTKYILKCRKCDEISFFHK